MEDHRIVGLGWQAGDDVALARVERVVGRGQHHSQGHTAVPLQLDLVQRAVGGVQKHVDQVALEAHHDRLGFRVTHAAVELQRLGVALRVDHQAGVQEAREGHAVLGHASQRRLDDLLHGLGVHIGRDHRRGRVGAHAARVGAFVAVEQALVVLAGGQHRHVLAVGHDDEAGLFAGQELLDHHTRAAGVVLHAQRVVQQHPVHRLVRFFQGHGHDHALARRQAVGLDDDGRAVLVDEGVGRLGVGEGFIEGRGDAMALHEVLGKSLGAFQLRGLLRGAEDAQATGPELVHDTGGQRGLRANHRQHDLVGLGEIGQRLDVGDGHVDQARIARRAAIARGHIDLARLGRLSQLPGQGVFTATRANDEDVHTGTLLSQFTQFNSAL